MKVYSNMVMVPIGDIKPYFNNPRVNDKTVLALVKYIPQVGFNVPLFIDQNKVIVKGHSRYYAAKELGLKEVPCIMSEATDKQNNADRLYDNAIQELSAWDSDKLLPEIRDLDIKLEEIDFKLDVDYSTEDHSKMYDSNVSQADMDKAQAGITGQYDDRDQKLKFQCPGCSKIIFFSKAQIEGLFKPDPNAF